MTRWGSWRRGGLRQLRRVPGLAIFASLLACLLLMPAAASAQTRAVVTATANARATIVAPLTLVKVQDMSFGKIVPRPTAGTVTVDQNTGQCSVTGTILEVGTCRYAQFASQGTKNMNARITLNVVSNLTGPGQTMVLDNIILGTNSTISFAGNSNANGSGVGLTQGSGNQRYTIVSNSGIFVLNIGGRLNVNANQARGIYTGSITVTVQYN